MADFGIEITGTVPVILKYENGKVFCNDGNGCEAINTDTGEILQTWTGTVDWEAWTPPEGIASVGFRARAI